MLDVDPDHGGQDSLDRLVYLILAELEERHQGKRTLQDSTAQDGWPDRGVYFFFEPGELRSDQKTPRVVRVGTHALRPRSGTSIWGRLAQHRGTTGGSLPGGGNHRGSIFRLHVGTALIQRDGLTNEATRTWGIGGSAPRATRSVEFGLEKAVSDHIRQLPLLWVDVPDPSGPDSARGMIESNMIALLSNLGREAINPASPAWLGRFADRQAVRDSHLWNVNHVDGAYDASFLDVLEHRVAQTSSARR